MLAGQADPFGYRTAGRCLLKGKRTPRPGTAGVAPWCARPTRAHREKLDTNSQIVRHSDTLTATLSDTLTLCSQIVRQSDTLQSECQMVRHSDSQVVRQLDTQPVRLSHSDSQTQLPFVHMQSRPEKGRCQGGTLSTVKPVKPVKMTHVLP